MPPEVSYTRPPVLARLGVRTAEAAREVRGVAYQVLQHVDRMHTAYGPCLAVGDDQEGDYSTLFLAQWLWLLDDLIVLYRLLARLGPPPATTPAERPRSATPPSVGLAPVMTTEGIPW
jgi:hypothetical protein